MLFTIASDKRFIDKNKSKYKKSNLSTNDHGCTGLDEMSYLFHIVIGKNAAPSVDYVGSFRLICQLTSHDHYRLRHSTGFIFSSLIMDICDRPSKHVEVE